MFSILPLSSEPHPYIGADRGRDTKKLLKEEICMFTDVLKKGVSRLEKVEEKVRNYQVGVKVKDTGASTKRAADKFKKEFNDEWNLRQIGRKKHGDKFDEKLKMEKKKMAKKYREMDKAWRDRQALLNVVNGTTLK